MTTTDATRLVWAQPAEPAVRGLVVTTDAPDDERRWVCEGPDRWMLWRSGTWRWSSVLAEAEPGAVVAVEFRCPQCTAVSAGPAHMRAGFCAICDAETGTV